MLQLKGNACVLAGLIVLACPLFGQTTTNITIAPTVTASILDQPRDGLGDSFDVNFPGLMREQSTRENRAIQEFDLSGLNPSVIIRATYNGRVAVNNAFNNGLRTFDFLVYPGNGVADLSDFEIPGAVVGSGSYAPPTDTSFSVTIDVTNEVLNALALGQNWLGIKGDPTSDPNFPNILDASNSALVIEVFGASATSVGSSCGQGNPVLTATAPAFGSTLAINLSGSVPNAAAFLAFDFGPAQNVPLGLGCTAQVGLSTFSLLGPFPTDAAGGFGLAFQVPNDLGLIGVTVTLQMVVAPSTGPFGIDLTNGMELVFGF